jgi:hypothetical protein
MTGRELGRPRLRWMADAENDLRELKVMRWRQTANSIEECVPVIKGTKVLKRTVQLKSK